MYVPIATLIVSPEAPFAIAPLIVAQGVDGVRQSLLSLPVGGGATYHVPAACAGREDGTTNAATTSESSTSASIGLEWVFMGFPCL